MGLLIPRLRSSELPLIDRLFFPREGPPSGPGGLRDFGLPAALVALRGFRAEQHEGVRGLRIVVDWPTVFIHVYRLAGLRIDKRGVH